MGHKSNEYEKQKLNKKYKVKKKDKRHEKNEDILLQQMQEQQRFCDADD